MNVDPYTYPDSNVLKNRFGLRDQNELDRMERQCVAQRMREDIPAGRFDLDHLQAIHRHLFQNVYEWAGAVRIVELSKSGHQFQFRRFIETGMIDISRRLEQADYLKNLRPAKFANQAGRIMGDVNYVHPFREGNGRAQLHYLKQLAAQAGHPLDLTRLDPTGWQDASRAAHSGDYEPLSREIRRALSVHDAD